MNQLLDTLDAGDQQALPAPLQHGAVGQRRDRAGSARPSAARSATARSPSGPCCPSCRARRSSPTRCASCPRCCRRTAPPRWRSVCALVAVADGRRRADQGAGRRHRHGPRLRRRQVHHAHRHPRRRGRLRRHGLQGRRHRRRSSPPCSSTPRSTASRPTCWPPRCEQAKEARLQILDVMNARHRRAPRRGGARRRRRSSSFTIPIDKIGEVIGPKGKVINTIQQETGADIAVDDDGVVGTVTIGSPDGLQGGRGPPPDRADHQPADGQGRRDLHRPGRQHHQVRCVRQHPPGPRRPGPHLQAGPAASGINRVEDVLDLGDEIEVRVDDIDPNGKVSLTPDRRRLRAAPARRRAGRAGVRARRPQPVSVAGGPADDVASRTRSTPRPARCSATSARRRGRRPSGRATAARRAVASAGRGG